jgi:hypothetical protein
MIKVPFDTPYHGDSDRGQMTTRLELERTLDTAYKTMDWFKFLADKAVRVEVLDLETTTKKGYITQWVGFELDGKNETFYRLKYDRYEK